MLGLMRSEFIKLRTLRSTVIASLFIILFPVVGVLLTVAVIGVPDSAMAASVLVNIGLVSALLCGVLGVFVIAQEYSQGTIRITFAASPKRMKVLVAKVLVVSLWIATCVGLIASIGLGGANIILENRDFSVGVMMGGETWQLLYALCAVCVLFGLVGFAFGSILRSSPGAIATLILVPLLVEGIVTGILLVAADIDISEWTPFTGAIRALQINSSDDRWGLIGYCSLWGAGFVFLAAVLMKRRDA